MDANATRTADPLHEMGQRLALQGGNPYRARAYSRAADGLRTLILTLEEVNAADRLRELPGVGEAMAAIIPVLHETGVAGGSAGAQHGVDCNLVERPGCCGFTRQRGCIVQAGLSLVALRDLRPRLTLRRRYPYIMKVTTGTTDSRDSPRVALGLRPARCSTANR